MPHSNYAEVIKENQKELQRLEKRHRYTHLFHRVKMLRHLVKSRSFCNFLQVGFPLYLSMNITPFP
jgi:hypothetical protein